MNTPELPTPAKSPVPMGAFYGTNVPRDPNAPRSDFLNRGAVEADIANTVRAAFIKDGIIEGRQYVDVRLADQDSAGASTPNSSVAPNSALGGFDAADAIAADYRLLMTGQAQGNTQEPPTHPQ